MVEKQFIRIVLEDVQFEYEQASSGEMCNLGFFLTDDVGCYSPWYKEWILDPRHELTGGNYSSLEKEGDYIFIGCEFDEDEPRLKIHRDELIKILDVWEQFCKTRPKEIMITKENDTFTIEAKD